MSHDPHSYNRAVRDCIAWLHRRTGEMNDPHARAILNSAAFSLGVDKPQFSHTPPEQSAAGHPVAVDGGTQARSSEGAERTP